MEVVALILETERLEDQVVALVDTSQLRVVRDKLARVTLEGTHRIPLTVLVVVVVRVALAPRVPYPETVV